MTPSTTLDETPAAPAPTKPKRTAGSGKTKLVRDYLVQRAVRLPISILSDLDNLVGTRKVSGKEPATMQAIMARALRDYLDAQPDL